MIGELKRCFTGDLGQLRASLHAPRPVQRAGFGGSGPPLMIGGTSERILRIAAEHAEIVGVAGAFQVRGQPPGAFLRLATAAETDQKVKFARQCAGARADQIEWHLLTQSVIITDDRRGAAEQLVAGHKQTAAQIGVTDERDLMSVSETLQTPYLLVGTADEIAGQLRRSRERWGFSYITVHEPFMPAFAPVIERLRGE